MKYVIETTKNGCKETITLSDGSKYSKTHTRTNCGSSTTNDNDFCEQMEMDGISDEITNAIYELLDGFFANDFMDIAELDK